MIERVYYGGFFDEFEVDYDNNGPDTDSVSDKNNINNIGGIRNEQIRVDKCSNCEEG